MEEIISRSNPICVHIRKLGKSKNYRDNHGQFLCDGMKLLEEALVSDSEIETVLLSVDLDISLPPDVRVFRVNNDMLDSLSPLKNSQGVLFTCRMKKAVTCDFSTGMHMLLDSIQDPGNIGTIIRSAHAFGINSVILTEGSADIYNPKTIRASMGAIFKQAIYSFSKSEIYRLKESGVRFFGASNDEASLDISSIDLKNAIIVLGNEGQGISEDLIAICNQVIKIPISNDCESINVAVAASIIMWEASKICRL